VADPDVEAAVADAALRTMFTTLPQINQCLLALPSTIRMFAPLDAMFNELPPVYEQQFQVHSCARESFIPSLKIRIAQVEDHDDLIPVLNSQSDLSTSTHGEFFLADIIEGQDDSHKCIVAEAEGKAIGLIAVTTEIDIDVLRACHHLEAYGNLVNLVECEPPEPEEIEEEEHDEPYREYNEEEMMEGAEGQGLSRRGSKVSAPGEDVSRRGSKIGEEAAAAGEAEPMAKPPTPPCKEPSEAQTYYEEVPNAFAITMFCLDKRHDCRAVDFLAPLFHVFGKEGGDYCILTLPHTECESPLMPYFTHVQPTESSTFPHSVYVLHRDALLPPPTVRYAVSADLKGVEELVAGLGSDNEGTRQQIIECCEKAGQEGETDVMCVACCGEQVVGVVGFTPKADVEALRGRYHLEEAVTLAEHPTHTNTATLQFFALHPTLECHGRHVLKETMRLTGRSLLTCSVRRDDHPPQMIHHFVQVQPRRQIQREKKWFDSVANVYKPRDAELDLASLHIFARRSIFEPKTIINARVLVVGASDTGLAFLESLLVVPYLHFTNLTLLTRGGLQPMEVPLKASSHSFAPEELHQLGLEHGVKIVDDTMVGLDRAAKHLELAGGGRLPYDYLVIAVGLQDQTHRKLQNPHEEALIGVFGIGDVQSVQNVLVMAQAQQVGSVSKIVIYGAELEAFSCVQGLLDEGIQASQLLLVLPVSEETTQAKDTYFSRYRLMDRITAQLESLKVEFTHGNITGFQGKDGYIRSASFIDDRGFEFEMDCSMLVCCSEGDIDVDAFNAVNDQSLVYDGRLVVDGRFRTNDHCIFAAGPVVKHQRKLRSPMLISCFNSREVGNRLAACVLPVLDPASAFDLDEPIALAPYLKPKAVAARVAGGLNFFVVEQPTHYGINPVAADGNLISEIQGRELITECGDEYSRITLNRYGCLCSLVHFGPAEVEHQNWICLYGLPETAINRLSSRYDEGIIEDLVSFLREDWAMALYHDGFVNFVKQLAAAMADDESVLAVKERVQSKLDAGDFKVDLELRRLVNASGHRKMWNKCEASLKQYLGQNQNHLPMYSIATAANWSNSQDAYKDSS